MPVSAPLVCAAEPNGLIVGSAGCAAPSVNQYECAKNCAPPLVPVAPYRPKASATEGDALAIGPTWPMNCTGMRPVLANALLIPMRRARAVSYGTSALASVNVPWVVVDALNVGIGRLTVWLNVESVVKKEP